MVHGVHHKENVCTSIHSVVEQRRSLHHESKSNTAQIQAVGGLGTGAYYLLLLMLYRCNNLV